MQSGTCQGGSWDRVQRVYQGETTPGHSCLRSPPRPPAISSVSAETMASSLSAPSILLAAQIAIDLSRIIKILEYLPQKSIFLGIWRNEPMNQQELE